MTMNTEPLTDEELMRVTTDLYTVSVKTIRRLAAELQALRLAHRWRPITEAPKDGTAILTADNEGRVITAWWQQDCWYTGWVSGGHRSDCEGVNATHWMPLPSAPERSQP